MRRIAARLLLVATASAALGGLPALSAAAAPSSLDEGSQPAGVRCWQSELDWYAAHYAEAKGLPLLRRDGIFGPATAAATAGFQRLALLPATGRVDPPTEARMRLAEALAVDKRHDRLARRLLARC